MFRALSLAVGITMCILGTECMVIDKAVLAQTEEQSEMPSPFRFAQPEMSRKREVELPEWAPWSLLSGGAVVILYSFTIPKRVAG